MKIFSRQAKTENKPKKGSPKTGKRIMAAYMALLMAFTTYFALDTFVITRVYGDAEAISGEDSNVSQSQGETQTQSEDSDSSADNGEQSGGGSHSGRHAKGHGPGGFKGNGKGSSSGSSGSESQSGSDTSDSNITYGSGSSAGSYSDSNIQITINEYRQNDTTIYAADVKVSSPEYLKTALAQNSYGKNVTEKTSEMASRAGAVLAINGDYYGVRENGYVIKNGNLYRSTSSGNEDLVIYSDGTFEIINEDNVTAEQLLAKGAVQTLSFGPALVENGKVSVTQDEEVGKAMANNPRTAIGIIDECHYVFVVSDGRTDESSGLSLYELAQFMQDLGVETAYNLDGGGSSTMYFKGSIVNNPTSGGSIKERSVSDIVYIG